MLRSAACRDAGLRWKIAIFRRRRNYMPINHALWTVGAQPVEVSRGKLATEQLLEEMIVSAPRISPPSGC